MSSSTATGKAMRADAMLSPCEEASQELRAVVIRKGPRRAQAKGNAVEDARAAAWFDAAVKAHGKASTLAEEMGIGEGDLSDMRSGKRSIALRRLLPLLGRTEAILAFVAPLLESIGYHARPTAAPTRAQVAEVAVRILAEGGRPTRELLQRECERQLGCTGEQVDAALRNTGEP